MRKILTSFFSIFILNVTGQIIVVEGNFEKQEYKLDETVRFIVDVNERIDSIVWGDTTDFQSKKTRSITMNSKYIDKVFINQTSYIYTLTPKRFGTLSLNNVVVYIKGNNYLIPKKTIIVLDKKQDINENRNHEIRQLHERLKLAFPTINNSLVKENTTRFLITGDLGYIEIFTNKNWQFYKALSQDEIILLNTLKK